MKSGSKAMRSERLQNYVEAYIALRNRAAGQRR